MFFCVFMSADPLISAPSTCICPRAIYFPGQVLVHGALVLKQRGDSSKWPDYFGAPPVLVQKVQADVPLGRGVKIYFSSQAGTVKSLR